MFYKPEGSGDLSQADLDAVRRGFNRLLVKRRFHPEFVLRHADDLLATAQAEYVRYCGKGVQIDEPVGWMIHCAWRRLQNVLSAANSRPQDISSEVLAELVDESMPTPAQIAEDADRVRKVHRALAKLDHPQRQIVALIYFEDLHLAEAARRLGWHESKARRCHDAAMKKLHRALAVKSSDQLAAEVGLGAWLSFVGGSGFNLPTGIEAAFDKASEGASGLWARAHELVRRFTVGGGSDTAAAVTTSGAGRAAGACATVAVACVVGASGIVGPGLSGIGIADGGHQQETTLSNPARIASEAQESARRESSDPSGRPSETSTSETGGDRQPTETNQPTPSQPPSEASQVEQQTSGIARASEPTSTGTTDTSSTSSSASGPREEQAQQQFQAFK